MSFITHSSWLIDSVLLQKSVGDFPGCLLLLAILTSFGAKLKFGHLIRILSLLAWSGSTGLRGLHPQLGLVALA
ncbi:hypothetical protein DFJ73DRAFT_848638 [Zopfochytrium polystomum]|nr:hypothetical protein DFJ73DRAFT_848638 [Zopfochytrium polystomum]